MRDAHCGRCRAPPMVDWMHKLVATVVLIVTVAGQCLCVGVSEKQYPRVVDFLVDFAHFYQYNELFVVIHQKDQKLLQEVARSLLRGEVEATTLIVRSYQKKYPNPKSLPLQTFYARDFTKYSFLRPDFPPVSVTKRPLFITTIANILDMEGEFGWSIGDASRLNPWLILSGDEIPIFTSSYYFPLDNLLTVASWSRPEDGKPVNVDLWEAYQPGPNFPQRNSVAGFWQDSSSGPEEEESAAGTKDTVQLHPKRGWYEFPDANFASRRTDLSGMHIKCLTESWQPFTDNIEGENGNIIIGGIMGESFQLMSKILNFTYSCRQAPDRQFGNKKDGVWTGLVRELIMGKGDVIIAPLDDTYERAQEIDFVVASGTITYDMIIKRPEPQTMTSFSRVLQPKSWHAYVLAIVITCLLYAHFILLGGKEGFKAVFDATFDIITIHLRQVTACMKTPRIPRRIFLLTTVLTAWMVLVYYTADLVAFLAIPDTDPLFSNMVGLLEYKEYYKLGLQRGNSEVERFRNATDVSLKRVWNEIIQKDPDNIVPTAEEGFRRVLKERFVFLTDEKYFRHHNSHNCSFLPVGMKLFQYGVGMAVQKNSPLSYVLNYQVLQQQSSGVMNRFKDKYNPKFDSCFTAATGPLSITTLASAFIIVLIGIILSVGFLVGERCCGQLEDTEYKLFSPDDRRLMTAPFEDGLKALGYIYDKEKGLLFKNFWTETDIYMLLNTYKKVKPKLFSILDSSKTLWRKVGTLMNRHPKLCERKFNDLVIKYEEIREDEGRGARRMRNTVYYDLLQELIEKDPAQALKNVVPDAGLLAVNLGNKSPDSLSDSAPTDNDEPILLQKSSGGRGVETSTIPTLPGDKGASTSKATQARP
ncbi:glutamate receptor ionotropic, kainate 2-like isoform X2 [Macrobrachium rosenbergii]|uniref:glutamate receptor ionotropic, kainate 2-like isoform X2 n=1 Tax=Macrobrachium rosenbergii TaxID=79674 RepID=UPI0034D770EB